MEMIERDGTTYPAARCPICHGLCFPAATLDAHIAWHTAEVERIALSQWDRKALGVSDGGNRAGIESRANVEAGRTAYKRRNRAA